MKRASIFLAVITGSLSLYGSAFAQQGSLGGVSVITGFEGSPPDWFYECTDPTTKTPLSANYGTEFVANQLMMCTAGLSGTWTAGGTPNPMTDPFPPCFTPPVPQQVMNAAGKFCFSYGYYSAQGVTTGGTTSQQANPGLAVASAQQYSPGFHDAAMAINYGAPTTPGDCYANFVEDGGTPVYFGQKISEFYVGQSNRYMTIVGAVGDFSIDLQVELVADAARFRWTCSNNSTASHTLSLWFASGIDMLDDQNNEYWATGAYAQGNFGQPYYVNSLSEYIGPDAAGEPFGYNGDPEPSGFFPPGRIQREEVAEVAEVLANSTAAAPSSGYQGIYVYLPVGRPPDTDVDYNQISDPNDFPPYADLIFGESDPFGIRIETQPSASTLDTVTSNIPTSAYDITFGKNYWILDGNAVGSSGDYVATTAAPIAAPANLQPDTGFLDFPAFVIKYNPVAIAAGATGQILNYVRSTWGNGSYTLPFGAVVDAPEVVQEGSTNYDGTASTTGLISNPMHIRVWIDNVGGNVTSGYGVDNKEFELDDVQVKLTFGVPGMTITSTGGATQTISAVAPRSAAFVDFFAQVGPDVVGAVPYTVTINTVPINTKIINGTIEVSGRPRFELVPGANLVTAPYIFSDSSWIAVLQNFVSPTVAGASAQAYIWDPNIEGYYPSETVSRGQAAWIVYSNPTGQPVWANFGGTPTTGMNFDGTTQQVELKPGWNLIANPFDLPFPVSQINGVAASNPDFVYTYNELVGLGYISGYVASWSPTAQNYSYVDATTGSLQPNTGYWVDDLLTTDITISYPPLFTEAAPGSYNRAPGSPSGPGLWQLQLNAGEGTSQDTGDTVGTTATASQVAQYTVYKAPMAPNQQLEMGIVNPAGAKKSQIRQALAATSSSYSWQASVYAAKAGNVTLTWPNVSSVPSKFGVYLVDNTSGAAIDMRKESSYTYTLVSGSTRLFSLLVKAPTTGSVIGSITGTATKVGTKAEEEIAYSLSTPATTTTAVYSSTGSLVATLHQNRVDKAGTSVDLWNLENSIGKTVAAGTYTVQVFAVTGSGEEETKTASIKVQ